MQIRRKRKELGLSINELADVIGVNERTVRRWENGDIETPYAITVLLWYMVEYGIPKVRIEE